MGRIIGGTGIVLAMVGISIFESAMCIGAILFLLGILAIFYAYKEYEL